MGIAKVDRKEVEEGNGGMKGFAEGYKETPE